MTDPASGNISPGLYLVFGLPGSGKSAAAKEIQKLGLVAVDADFEPKLSAWVNITTGHRLTSLPGFPLTQDWRNTHRWYWDAEHFDMLAKRAAHKPIFICGDADNLEDFFPKFRLRFALHVDNETMANRLKSRDANRWNDRDPELAETMGWNATFVQSWKSDEIILIDGDRPTNLIVQEILQKASK